MNDPRPFLTRAADQAGRLIDLVEPRDLTKPTPCTEYDVRTLLGHLLSVVRRIGFALSGDDPQTVPTVTEGVEDVPAAWKEYRARMELVLASPDVLDRTCTVAWGTHPGRAVIGTYTSELTTHGWDLATALGRTEFLDDDLARFSLILAHQFLPEEPRGGPVPFGPVVPVAEDASPYELLAAWQGRSV